METIYVYHVVTEKPMRLGQKILFDKNNHNGVYNRVMTFKRIVEGEDVHGAIADFIKSDLDKWVKFEIKNVVEYLKERICSHNKKSYLRLPCNILLISI